MIGEGECERVYDDEREPVALVTYKSHRIITFSDCALSSVIQLLSTKLSVNTTVYLVFYIYDNKILIRIISKVIYPW